MIFCDFNINKNYFLMNPRIALSCEEYGLEEINEKEFILTVTDEKYYLISSYDFGEGPEICYMLDRKYSFDELIKLALVESFEEKQYVLNTHATVRKLYQADKNHYGAIDFIINGTPYQDNFITEFVKFLTHNVIENNNLDKSNKFYLKKFFYEEWGEEKYRYIKKLDRNSEWTKIKSQILGFFNNNPLCNEILM